MLSTARALKLDFFPTASAAPSGRQAARWVLAPRQRRAPPHKFDHVLIAAVDPVAAVDAMPGSTLSIGPFTPRHEWDGEPDEARLRFALLAITNAREGMEAEFEDWYWHRHFPDGRRLPGCYAGRRFLLAPQGIGGFRHLAVYLFDGEVGDTLDTLARISGTPEMPGTPAISPIYEDWYVQQDR